MHDPRSSIRIALADADFDRRSIDHLMLLADDSAMAIARYRDHGELWLATDTGDAVIGHVLVLRDDHGEVAELVNLAVLETHQSQGIGRTMVTTVLDALATSGVRRIIVATAIEDLAALHFYFRMGFRAFAVERDAFTPERGYPADLAVDGIPVRDRIVLDLVLDPEMP
jgi:predicted N-acetyltransferase YhbS